jgi:hypothetical protein
MPNWSKDSSNFKDDIKAAEKNIILVLLLNRHHTKNETDGKELN